MHSHFWYVPRSTVHFNFFMIQICKFYIDNLSLWGLGFFQNMWKSKSDTLICSKLCCLCIKQQKSINKGFSENTRWQRRDFGRSRGKRWKEFGMTARDETRRGPHTAAGAQEAVCGAGWLTRHRSSTARTTPPPTHPNPPPTVWRHGAEQSPTAGWQIHLFRRTKWQAEARSAMAQGNAGRLSCCCHVTAISVSQGG